MQDRYAGDIGDFVKLGLLRHLSRNRDLGIAWYRYPDEDHNGDGRHTSYLSHPDRYRQLDPELFDHLADVVQAERSLKSLLPIIEARASSDISLDVRNVPYTQRRRWRKEWFRSLKEELKSCDIVFADPDNGIVDDNDHRKGSAKFGKQIPLKEVQDLATGRCAIIYHHNTRRAGGHDAEVDFWLSQFGVPALAVRATAYSPRTFFVLNPDEEMRGRIRNFCASWHPLKVSLHRQHEELQPLSAPHQAT